MTNKIAKKLNKTKHGLCECAQRVKRLNKTEVVSHQYDDGVDAVSSQLVEVLWQTVERHVVDCKHFSHVVMVDIGVLDVLQRHISSW